MALPLYGHRGRYTPAEQQRRERLRLEAAGRFAAGGRVSEIARDLRVTPGLVRRWRRGWRDGGTCSPSPYTFHRRPRSSNRQAMTLPIAARGRDLRGASSTAGAEAPF